MQLDTRAWGPLDIDEHDIINFQDPILGFEERQWVLLPGVGHLHYLQSCTRPSVFFLVLDIMAYDPAYQLPPEEIPDTYHTASERAILLICTARADRLTANYRSPLLVHQPSHTASQIVLRDASYPFDQVIDVAKAGEQHVSA